MYPHLMKTTSVAMPFQLNVCIVYNADPGLFCTVELHKIPDN